MAAEHKGIVGGLGVALMVLGGGTLLSRPIVSAEYPRAHFPGWTSVVGIALVVTGLYLFLAVIRDLPFPGRKRPPTLSQPPSGPGQPPLTRSEVLTAPRKSLVVTVDELGSYMTRQPWTRDDGVPIVDLNSAVHVANPNGDSVQVLKCYLQTIFCTLQDGTNIRGMPNLQLEPNDPGDFGLPGLPDEPCVIGGGKTELVTCSFPLQLSESGDLPKRVQGHVVVVDSFNMRHLAAAPSTFDLESPVARGQRMTLSTALSVDVGDGEPWDHPG